MFSRVRIAIRFFFVGLAVGVLLAPRSGVETRRLLRQRADRALSDLLDAATMSVPGTAGGSTRADGGSTRADGGDSARTDGGDSARTDGGDGARADGGALASASGSSDGGGGDGGGDGGGSPDGDSAWEEPAMSSEEA